MQQLLCQYARRLLSRDKSHHPNKGVQDLFKTNRISLNLKAKNNGIFLIVYEISSDGKYIQKVIYPLGSSHP